MSARWGRYLPVVVASALTLPPSGWCQATASSPQGDQALRMAPAAGRTAPAIRVLVDPRVELMAIVFRLAGHPEYSMGRVRSYTADVDRHFAAFKDHPVVARARQLRKARGISYNAPMSLAVHLTNPPALAERVPLDSPPPGIDRRWTPAEARAFLADLRSFVLEANVMEFLARHAPLYQAATGRLVSLAREAGVVEWLEGFFGRQEDRELVLVAALLNGGGNYGAFTSGIGPGRASSAGGRGADEIFAIIGTESIDENDLPSYPARVAATVVHEFSHSFINPLVDGHQADLEAAASRLFPLVEGRMRSQAYGVPATMLSESLVRACTIRYLSRQLGGELARRQAVLERGSGFPWVGRLADTLLEYEKNRVRYSTMEAFVPRLVSFFEDYSRIAPEDLRAAEAEQQARREALAGTGPKIVSMSPPDGATDVDATTVTVIAITFDRPMRDGNFAVFPVANTTLPTLAGPPRFGPDGRTITLTCTLRPGVTYGLQFNSPEHPAFVDMEGHPLAPVVYRFTTKR